MANSDDLVRAAAFQWLREQVDRHGDVLPRPLLAAGFDFAGHRVPMLGPQGIFKPRIMATPLSITTAFDGPYSDVIGPNGLEYRYRGTDPRHHDNVGLRTLMKDRAPLVYFHALVPGKYLAWWPVYVVGDDPGRLTFTVAVDDASMATAVPNDRGHSVADDEVARIRRQYVTTIATRRVHQAAFRERVIRAYREACALCRLRHVELLDAAHIIPDSDPDGDPEIRNGLALCKLHHAAYDRQFLAIRPDYVVVVREDILRESDGPVLRHGLQGVHNQAIHIPTRTSEQPDKALLERRYESFLATV